MSDKKPAAIVAGDVEPRLGSSYPPAFARMVEGRAKRVLGDRFGLDQFGVNLVTLAPGARSAIRHWHEREDEFIYVLDGAIVLSDEEGDHQLQPGMCAGFKAGVANGHCLVNRTAKPVTYLEIGTRSQDEVAHYPDVDLKARKTAGKFHFTRKNGSPV